MFVFCVICYFWGIWGFLLKAGCFFLLWKPLLYVVSVIESRSDKMICLFWRVLRGMQTLLLQSGTLKGHRCGPILSTETTHGMKLEKENVKKHYLHSLTILVPFMGYVIL